MTILDAQPAKASTTATQYAMRAIFLIAGTGMVAWAPLVPYAKDRAHLSDGALGTLLLFLGLGSLVAMPLTGMLIGRFGSSNAVPILFSAAGDQKTMPVNLAISSMTTIGYAGILAGPPLIGFISQWYSLATAFSAISLLLLAVVACARLITR